MDVLNLLDVSVSPVSLVWVGSILAASVSIYSNVLSPSKFTFVAARMKQEPWRLPLSFVYLGPPLISLIQNCYFVAKTVGLLEEVYTFSFGVIPQAWTCHLDEQLRIKAKEMIVRNRSRDFAYFIVQLGLTIALAIWLLSYFGKGQKIYFLGPPLQRVMLYIRCRLYPEQQINIMGLGVKSKYAFAASQFLDFLISEEYYLVITLLSKSPYLALQRFFSSQILYEAVLEFLVGHFWWYLRYFYLDEMYNDSLDDWNMAYYKVQGGKLSFQEILRFCITPFWYKSLMVKLRAEQLMRILFANGETLTEARLAQSIDEFRQRLDDITAAHGNQVPVTNVENASEVNDEHDEEERDAADEGDEGLEDVPSFEGTTGMNPRRND